MADEHIQYARNRREFLYHLITDHCFFGGHQLFDCLLASLLFPAIAAIEGVKKYVGVDESEHECNPGRLTLYTALIHFLASKFSPGTNIAQLFHKLKVLVACQFLPHIRIEPLAECLIEGGVF